MRQGPVFYDPGGKRHKVVKSGGRVAGLIVGVISTIFIISLLGVSITKLRAPKLPPPGYAASPSLIPKRVRGGPSGIVTGRFREQLIDLIANPKAIETKKKTTAQRIIGFYNLEDSGYQSFQNNVKNLTHFMPQWLNVSEDGRSLETDQLDHDINLASIKAKCSAFGVKLEPILTNYEGVEPDAGFSSETAHKLLTSPRNQDRVIAQIKAKLIAEKMDGVNVDIENIDDADRPYFGVFLGKLAASLHAANLELSVDLEAGAGANWQALYIQPCDFGVLMAYDEHDENGDAGPLAEWTFVESTLKAALDAKIPKEKIVLGMGAYSLDWKVGHSGDANTLSFQEGLTLAAESLEDVPAKKAIKFDKQAQNCYFEYKDDDGVSRICWMQDGISTFNSWTIGRALGITGFSVWAMGEEDPTIWSFLDRGSSDFPDPQKHLEEIHVPYEVENVGKGDLLSVGSHLSDGRRSLTFAKGTGLIDSIEYQSFPSAWRIDHHGYVPKHVVLTFDDGPDPNYTPRILDVLKRENVRATFFMLGEKMEENPGIVQRAYREGHEIGSHTFFHPDLSEVSDRRIELELNATQRSIESIVGRATSLLRPPYNADRDPGTEKEVHPIVIADAMGYTIVGESIDPNDWAPDRQDPVTGIFRKRTVQDIVDDTVAMVQEFDQPNKANRDASNCILLHDAGGDREKTVAALPQIIEKLESKGYQFCNVSDMVALEPKVRELYQDLDRKPGDPNKIDQTTFLARVRELPIGGNRDRVMPPIPDRDRLYIVLDKIAFTTIFTLLQLLAIAFLTAITLGILRVAVVVPLAILYERRQQRVVYDPGFRPPISVVIAAYNEERVIVRTIQSVLESDYPVDEVIVVNDGSVDGTEEAITAAFSMNPRVHLITQENTGKAEALNQTLLASKNDILISVDADTQLPPETIGLLVRHFENPKIGAVAGNVQVGNMHNVVTTWQGIEYTTSQNMDRRAYGLLGCITVVPGAIGGWRKQAVIDVGGHQDDTLAEDMDLTWRLKIAGWQQETESSAFAYTEAPETIKTFFRQRFRWSYGTLQCLVKHRKAMFRYGFFGWFALPVIWLFQIIFQAIAPLVDLQIVISLLGFALALFSDSSKESSPLGQSVANLQEAAVLYLVFFGVEMLSAMIAYRLERKRFSSLWWLFLQRFVYRQVMYAVIYRSLVMAVRGARQGWGKLDRTARVKF